MMAALRPHGWLLVEELDFVTVYQTCASEPVCKVVTTGLRALKAMSGVQSEYGRCLLDDVCRHGLVDVEAEGRGLMIRGGWAGMPRALRRESSLFGKKWSTR